MGCDIHSRAERCINGKWEVIPNLHPFDCRSYGVFGFLADVRNYSAVPPISDARGLPGDHAPEDQDNGWLGEHSQSWLSIEELLAFNYDAEIEDRRVSRQLGPNLWTGAATADPGGGEMTTFRSFLGDWFFEELEKLKAAGAERIVFGFDS